MTENKKKLWILTFEYSGIAKVGGLGEVPANQTKYLADQFDITVFIPSHNQVDRLKKCLEWEKLPLIYVGQFNPSYLGINKPKNNFVISFYMFRNSNVKIVLLSGENSFANEFLDDKIVYNPDTFNGKLCLFSIGMRYFTNFLVKNRKEDIPNIIHMHDFHVVIPFIGIKQELNQHGLDVQSIITFHLLTWPRYKIDFYYECGVDETPFKILLKSGLNLMSLSEIFTLCKDTKNLNEDYYPPTVEKIGAVVSDLVTTVSNSYLHSDIIPNLGQDIIEFKSDFIWDGCDWDYNIIFQNVLDVLGDEMREILGISGESEITRTDMKKYLLTYKIGHLNQSSLINSKRILDTINEISNENTFVKNGKLKSFSETGPLVIGTGRITKQKGFETIFEAIPKVIKVIPNLKFLLLILPTDYSLNEIKVYSNYVKKYPKNLRIIFGLSAEIFYLAHIAADIYCALSRWEPFGIIALEAMSLKLPIIATKVGGLQETIIDVREDPVNGTGILIEKDNPSQFANALISLSKLAEIDDIVKITGSIYETKPLQIVNQIPDIILKARVLLDGNYYNKIKDNCYKRVENNFRWSIVSKKLIELYARVREMHPI